MKELSEEQLILTALKSVKKGKKSANPQLVILMGLPGSGKSYASDYLHRAHGYTIISGENVTYAIFGTEKCSGSDYALAYKILRKTAAKLISDGYSVVVDGTNLKYVFRQQIYSEINCDRSFLIHLVTDDKTALYRANHRGEDYQDLKNIKSSCSPETFESFKSQVELPQPSENSFTLISDDQLFARLDSVLNQT